MNGKVFVISSVVSGNGAKYLATNLAFERQVKVKDKKKVLLIDFDFENPTLAYQYVKNDSVHGIDNLIINGDAVNEDLFMENIIKTTIKVDVLKGTKFSDNIKVFTKEQIEKIIQISKDTYDFIYIVVSGKSNNAGTVYSLLNADKVTIVAQNNYSNMQKIERMTKMINSYYKKDEELLLVYNFNNINSLADVGSKLTKTQVAGILAYDDKSIDNIDIEKKLSKFASKGNNFKEFQKINSLLGED
ncbi:MAG: hypothetical protein K0R54_666 [Clostridiaceae bacterium]|jgi:cellulose biosynthesis protein BcsQ|nr:hypothetical protein [Clostridiaceae bacterium]